MGWLILCRHASTAASAAGRNLGQRDDLPISEAGRHVARHLGDALSAELAELDATDLRLISSPALRCRQTAASVSDAIRLVGDVETDPRLIEIDYGDWDGLTPEECAARDPELRAAWERDPAATRCPGGESGGDVDARSRPAFEALSEWLSGRDDRAAVVVAHNHVNRLALCRVLGWPLSDYRRRLVQSPGGYNVIRDTPDGQVIVRLNAPARSAGKPPTG